VSGFVMIGVAKGVLAEHDKVYAPDPELAKSLTASFPMSHSFAGFGQTALGMTSGFTAVPFEERTPEERRQSARFVNKFRTAMDGGLTPPMSWRLPHEALEVQARWDQRRMDRNTGPALGATRRTGRL
jgi:hypothetical protein